MTSKEIAGNNLQKLFVIVAFVMLAILLKDLLIILVNPLLANVSGKAYLWAIKSLNLVSTLIVFFIPSLIISRIFAQDKKVFSYLNMDAFASVRLFCIAFFLLVLLLPLVGVLASYFSSISFPESMKGIERILVEAEQQRMQATTNLLSGDGFGWIFLDVFIVAFVPALCEEMFFRGIVQKYLLEIIDNKHCAIVFGAVIFSAVHFQFSGFVSRIILALLLGYLFYYTKSLWVSIFVHFTNNMFAVITIHLYGIETKMPINWNICVIALLCALCGFVLLKSFFKGIKY